MLKFGSLAMDISKLVKQSLELGSHTEKVTTEKKAVVFWIEECKASIVPLHYIPEKDRKEGCQSEVLWRIPKKNRKPERYMASIITISGKYILK